VWENDSLYFSTGPEERKAANLGRNARVVITTGCNEFRRGLDVVIEGEAVAVHGRSTLHRLANAFATKYEGNSGLTASDGRFTQQGGGVADVYEVTPARIFAYGRGATFSATRFRFSVS
jgi:hypothetical protein